MFNSWGIVNAYGTYLAYYNESLLKGQSPLLLNLIGSTQCFMILFFSFIVGRLLDANYSRALMAVGFCLVTLGMFLLSVVNGGGGENEGNYILTWLVQGVIAGLGMACFFTTSSQVVSTWFQGKVKPFAMAFVASGAAISGLVFPFMLRFLIESKGFNFSDRMISTLAVGTMLTSLVLVQPSPNFTARTPDTWLSFNTWYDKGAFRSPMFCWLTAGNCFMFFGFYAVFFNLEEWSVKRGVGTKGDPQPGQDVLKTYYLLAIMNATSTLGRIGSAFLCMPFNPVKVHCVVTFISSMLCFFFWTFASKLSFALGFVVVFGAFSGSVIGLPPASMATIMLGDHRMLGQWTGMMYTISAPFALTGPLIAGYLISEYGQDYRTVQCWSGACLLLSAACQAVTVFYYTRATKWEDGLEKLDTSGTTTPMVMAR
ncbi:hypothetical protein AAFC00_005883 [Neodothiora populina]